MIEDHDTVTVTLPEIAAEAVHSVLMAREILAGYLEVHDRALLIALTDALYPDPTGDPERAN